MKKEKIDFQRLDRPLSFRVPKELHEKYKSLSGYKRKHIQYLFVRYVERLLKSRR